MTKNYFISIYLDTRRAKLSGKYPVKLRVFTNQPRVQKLYPTIFEMTESEFKSIWETTKPRNEHKEIRLKLQSVETNANTIAEKLPFFTFDSFERLLNSNNAYTNNDVNYYYEHAIETYKKNQQLGTASNYDFSLKSLLEYHKKSVLSFYTITPQWLKDYERFMIEKKKNSQTTVGYYLRPLRAIFNNAILNEDVSKELYPFGKGKYVIPAPKGTKRALSKEQLKLLFESVPETSDQQKAKDFWFFSYSCNGINIKDIVNLQYKNISGDTLVFKRAKTANTNKAQASIIAYLNDFTRSVIKKYGNKKISAETYIFPIISDDDSPDDKHRKKLNFIRYISQHFGKFAKKIGIDENISTYWARHSFATNAIRSGASIEFVSEALNHTNINTTKSYFAGFEDDKKREISYKLMQF